MFDLLGVDLILLSYFFFLVLFIEVIPVLIVFIVFIVAVVIVVAWDFPSSAASACLFLLE